MSASTDLLIATRNAGKIREFASLFEELPVRLRSLSEFPQAAAAEVEETGATFAENSALKARFYAALTGIWTLADDSGLEVEALGGAPGIYSARYAGANASDMERVRRLLEELRQTGDARRRARFVCTITLAQPRPLTLDKFTGICEGRIAAAPRGQGGFGYDPIFIPDGYDQTFGELSSEIKQQISHRALALRAAYSFLRERLRRCSA